MADSIFCSIQGDGIYETLRLPAVPRKGDILWLASLTGGRYEGPNVLVSKVEWGMEQQTRETHIWITVRRVAIHQQDTDRAAR